MDGEGEVEGGGWGGGDGSILWQATENKKHVFCLPVFLVHILLLKEMKSSNVGYIIQLTLLLAPIKLMG